MILFSDKHPFVMRRHHLHLGWVIFNKDSKTVLVHTSDKEVAKEIWESIEAMEQPSYAFVRKIPKNFTPKLLVIETHHGNTYLLIRKEKEFKENLMKLIKQEVESKYTSISHWELSEEKKSNLLTKKEIANLPTESVRKYYNTLREEILIQEKAYNDHNAVVDKVREIVKNNDIGKIWQIFQRLDMYWDRWEIVDFYE